MRLKTGGCNAPDQGGSGDGIYYETRRGPPKDQEATRLTSSRVEAEYKCIEQSQPLLNAGYRSQAPVVLKLLLDAGRQLDAKEIAKKLGIRPQRTRDVLHILETVGFVAHVDQDCLPHRVYQPSPAFYELLQEDRQQ